MIPNQSFRLVEAEPHADAWGVLSKTNEVRPTEEEALRNLELYNRVRWRLRRYGYLRLTAREQQAVRLEREFVRKNYTDVQKRIAKRMRCTQSVVSRTLARAQQVLEVLEDYPQLGVPRIIGLTEEEPAA